MTQVAHQAGRNGTSSSNGWIGGNSYRVHPEGFATHSIPPGVRPGPEVHVTAPHPDPALQALGWRIAFVFFALISGLCLAAYLLPIPWAALLQR